MDIGSLLVSGAALAVSLLSYYFSIKSWRESNRPIVTARVSTHEGGNVGIALNIVVQNTGNRPAKNVRLAVDRSALEAALSSDTLREQVHRCFSDEAVIPVLENGRFVSNSFGALSDQANKSTWKPNSKLDIDVSYQDLDGRKFNHHIPLLVADDAGFAGSFWGDSREA